MSSTVVLHRGSRRTAYEPSSLKKRPYQSQEVIYIVCYFLTCGGRQPKDKTFQIVTHTELLLSFDLFGDLAGVDLSVVWRALEPCRAWDNQQGDPCEPW